MRRRDMSPAKQENRRVKNREGMRKARARHRQELLLMRATLAQLEKQYAELLRRVAAAIGKSATLATCNKHPGEEDDDHNLVAIAKRLGAEKLQLQAILKQKLAWTMQIQRALDFEASSLAAEQHFQPQPKQTINDIYSVDGTLIRQELGFHPVAERDLTRFILDNKCLMNRVESRLHLPLEELKEQRVHRMQAFGWDIVQRVEGSVMEFVFTKKFTNLNVFDVMHKTWTNDTMLSRFKTVKAETARLQVLQQINPNAVVCVRDVNSCGDISVFRSVFVHFLVEASREFATDTETLTGTGFVLGTQSIATDSSLCAMERDEAGRKIAWADLALTSEAYDVVDPATGEHYQQVIWAGQTDYCTEEDAHRNAADTLQGLLRWEMRLVAPALQL